MSSETKSRAGRTAEQVVNEWRESGSQDWGQLVSAINYWAVTDMCPALESSSSADTGGRGAALTVEDVFNSYSFVGWEEQEQEGPHRGRNKGWTEWTRRLNEILAARGADPGTTGAEGPSMEEIGMGDLAWSLAHAALKEKWSDAKLGPAIAKFAMDWHAERAATQRAPVTPPAPQFTVCRGEPTKSTGTADTYAVNGVAAPAPVTTPGRDGLLTVEQVDNFCLRAARHREMTPIQRTELLTKLLNEALAKL